jgi:hypothetical protein
MISFRVRDSRWMTLALAASALVFFVFPAATKAGVTIETILEPTRPLVGQLVVARVQVTDAQVADRFAVDIQSQGAIVVQSSSLAGPAFQVAFTPQLAGSYVLFVRKENALERSPLATKEFFVVDHPTSKQEIAQGVLILLVTGGVIIALVIAAIIILRWPRRRQEKP